MAGAAMPEVLAVFRAKADVGAAIAKMKLMGQEFKKSAKESTKGFETSLSELSAKADATERGIVERGNRRGAGNMVVRKEREEPGEDRRRGFCRQLLADDRPNERAQVVRALTSRYPLPY